jgi:hypothetical protein
MHVGDYKHASFAVQRRRLQPVAWLLTGKLDFGRIAQLGIDKWPQLLRCCPSPDSMHAITIVTSLLSPSLRTPKRSS